MKTFFQAGFLLIFSSMSTMPAYSNNWEALKTQWGPTIVGKFRPSGELMMITLNCLTGLSSVTFFLNTPTKKPIVFVVIDGKRYPQTGRFNIVDGVQSIILSGQPAKNVTEALLNSGQMDDHDGTLPKEMAFQITPNSKTQKLSLPALQSVYSNSIGTCPEQPKVQANSAQSTTKPQAKTPPQRETTPSQSLSTKSSSNCSMWNEPFTGSGVAEKGTFQDANGNNVTVTVLKLDKPPCFAKGQGEDQPAVGPQLLMQIANVAIGSLPIGQRLSVKGTPFIAHTGHHHTQVLLSDVSFGPADD